MKPMVESLYQERQVRPKHLQNLGTGILNHWIPAFPFPAIYQLSSSEIYVCGCGQDAEIPGPDSWLSNPRHLPEVQPSSRAWAGWLICCVCSAGTWHSYASSGSPLGAASATTAFSNGRTADPNVSGRSTSQMWCLGCLHGRVITIAPSEML